MFLIKLSETAEIRALVAISQEASTPFTKTRIEKGLLIELLFL